MEQNKTFAAILLMAGNSHRLNEPVKKPFQQLGDKLVYEWSLECFIKHPQIDQVYLVVHEEDQDKVQPRKAKIVLGGKSRLESSCNGVKACNEDFVLIHDVARPFVSAKIIDQNIKKVIEYKAVDTCLKVSDTMIETLDGKQLNQILNRETIYHGQTPQSFERSLILKAQQKALENGLHLACDCGLVKRLNHEVHLVEGSSLNFKITYKEDLMLARALLDAIKLQNVLLSSEI